MYAPPLFDAPFIFLRHGETETNRLGLTAGMTDVALNEHGKLQAQAAAAVLVDQGVDALYSSPLKRSLATAQCIGRLLHLPIVTIAELGERNWGTQEGLPRQTRDRAAKPEGGESLEEFTARTLHGLAKIPRSRLPLIVAHSGTFRVICAQLGMDIESQVENCHPLRFSPPRDRAERWRVEPL